jgi:putative ABC transport system ATP-binding protein
MIRLHEVTKSYRSAGDVDLPVLKGISTEIGRHEFVAIMGPSGSGKSTLMNILGCLDTVDQGSYELDGQRIDSLDTNALARIRNLKFGFVFQMFNLVPRLSALRNVELPMIYGRIPAAERRRRATEALARVGLAERCSHSPSQLSGGQQQRVAIARALVNNPQIIIADEPTGSLDSASGESIMQTFGELHAQGKTIIMVTHENDIAAHAERVIRLRDGHIVEGNRR